AEEAGSPAFLSGQPRWPVKALLPSGSCKARLTECQKNSAQTGASALDAQWLQPAEGRFIAEAVKVTNIKLMRGWLLTYL
ncbi:hypothetical protein EL09_22385, partial [Salmonella enterica subsp. enterica]|nr:hypothetical protein [Salmonella enterica subsp. enterica]